MPVFVQRKYGQETTVVFPLIEYGATDLEPNVDAGSVNPLVYFEAGDVWVITDEDSAQQSSNLPINVGEGIYRLTLTVAEMSAKRVYVRIRDQGQPIFVGGSDSGNRSGLKHWEDEYLIIETYGHSEAQFGSYLGGPRFAL